MSQHGCPERLSNRSKGFQEDGPSQPTMEVLVETLTGTAFEMTVSPSDTIFAIKSKIFRVEGIPVSQQHLLYNLKELDDASSLREHAIADGARLRLVLGMRGGPISTRRLPLPAPAHAEPWPDIERLLDSNRDDAEWTGGGCKVTVLVFRDGERVNMLRVRENRDGTYSPLDSSKYSGRVSQLAERGAEGAGALRENAVTMGKMMHLRRRMEALSLQRAAEPPRAGDKVEIQKTRSEETLSAPHLLDEAGAEPYARAFASYGDAEDSFSPVYDRNYTRYEYECPARDSDPAPPAPRRASRREGDDGAILEECLGDECVRPEPPRLQPRDYGPLVGGCAWRGGHSASALQLRAGAPLEGALFSSSTSDLENLKRNSRILPALSRARPREHLHLSDEGLHLPRREHAAPAPPAPAPPAPPRPPRREGGSERRQQRIQKITSLDTRVLRLADDAPPAADGKEKKIRIRCGFCKKRLSVATEHRCRCGASYCAPHRYAEVHGCAYDYKAAAGRLLAQDNPRVAAPKLPKI